MFTTSFSVAGILSTSNPSEATALRASEGLKVGVAYAGGLVLMNQSLLINPVAVYQLLKMACIPTIAIIQSYYGVRLSRLSVFSLGLILLGVSVSTFLPKGSSGGTVGKSVDVSLLGLLYGFLGVLATSAGQVWMQTRPTIRSLSGLQTIAVISPYAFAVCAASALIADLDWSTVSFRAVSEAAHWQEMWTQITKWLFEIPSNIPLVAVLTSCALSVVTNLFGFVLIQRTSAITYQVVGHFKTVLTVTVGAFFFPSAAASDARMWFGITVTLTGIVLYSFSKR
ncbi:hypothetical protein DFJ73DRAFT_36802 [Zopfochytrium polystomum]|nr:hypothetical protein DFJ73DRAFT_36802 [Zopfochytrium polystomum]